MDKKQVNTLDVIYSGLECVIDVAGFFCLLGQLQKLESFALRLTLFLALGFFTVWGFVRAYGKLVVVWGDK